MYNFKKNELSIYIELLLFVCIFAFLDYGARLVSNDQTLKLKSIIEKSFKQSDNIQCSYFLNVCYIDYIENEIIKAKNITIEKINEFNLIDKKQFNNIPLKLTIGSLELKYINYKHTLKNVNITTNISLNLNKNLIIDNTIEFKNSTYNLISKFNLHYEDFNINDINMNNIKLLNNFKFEISKFNNDNIKDLYQMFYFDGIDKKSDDYNKLNVFVNDSTSKIKFNAEINHKIFNNIKINY